jgi:hypothetical protein
MIAKAKYDNTSNLNPNLREYAFTQDDQGSLEVTPDREYRVFGVQKNDLGNFYLVLTDSIHANVPWWMPAELYEVVESTIPENWVERSVAHLKRVGCRICHI